MARQRKKRRTQALGSSQNARAQGLTSNRNASTSASAPEARIPKSMVLRMGGSRIGPSVSQLALDVRSVMEPHTASRLKERRTNKLRDFTTMARPLGVSHILAFYRSEKSGNVNLNIIVSPRGPTFSFRIEKYSLARDVAKMQKRPKTASGEALSPPLLVMNNFKTQNVAEKASKAKDVDADTHAKPVPKYLEDLSVSIFQSMFPAVQPQKTPLDSIKRVLLLNRLPAPAGEEGTYTLQFRHYAISAKRVMHLSKGIKRLRAAEKFAKSAPRKLPLLDASAVHSGLNDRRSNEHNSLNDNNENADRPREGRAESTKRRKEGSLPNLSKMDDIADYILDPGAAGYTSASETEADTDAEVEVLESSARKVLNRRTRQRIGQNNNNANGNGNINDEDEENWNDLEPSKSAPRKVEKRAIKLSELGPRMTLRLIKVQEGVAEGRVLWHEYLSKSAAEEKQLEQVHELRRAEKEERRQIQKENIERKKAAKKGAKRGGKKEGDGEGDEDEDMDAEDWDDMDDEMLDEMMDDMGEDEEEDEEEEEGEEEDED